MTAKFITVVIIINPAAADAPGQLASKSNKAGVRWGGEGVRWRNTPPLPPSSRVKHQPSSRRVEWN